VKNLETEIAEELAETIVIKEGGLTKTVTKRRAMIKRLIGRVLQGDPAGIHLRRPP